MLEKFSKVCLSVFTNITILRIILGVEKEICTELRKGTCDHRGRNASYSEDNRLIHAEFGLIKLFLYAEQGILRLPRNL